MDNAWQARRFLVSVIIGGELNPDSMIDTVLRSKEKWDAIAYYIREVTRKKGKEVR